MPASLVVVMHISVRNEIHSFIRFTSVADHSFSARFACTRPAPPSDGARPSTASAARRPVPIGAVPTSVPLSNYLPVPDGVHSFTAKRCPARSRVHSLIAKRSCASVGRLTALDQCRGRASAAPFGIQQRVAEIVRLQRSGTVHPSRVASMPAHPLIRCSSVDTLWDSPKACRPSADSSPALPAHKETSS